MTQERVFADFYENALPFQMSGMPAGGMCLSVFLILMKSNTRNVLLGRVNPEADWVQLGALGKEYAEKVSKGWMLPSSHLLMYESPHDAVSRVLKEQLSLSLSDLRAETLKVFSEVYTRYKHWDVEFVEIAELGSRTEIENNAWQEIKFMDPRSLDDRDFSRSHHDILREAGLR